MARSGKPKRIISINPFNGKKLAEITPTSTKELEKIISKSRRAQSRLMELSLNQRAVIAKNILKAIGDDAEDIAKVTTLETGLPIKSSTGLVSALIDRGRWFIDNSKRYLKPEVIDLKDGIVNEICFEPVGVVAIISSWNAPASQTIWCAIPAILAGNTVIHKSSEFSSLCSKKLQQAFDKAAIPPGIVQTVYGDKALGQSLVEGCDFIAFAGSIRAGQDVIRRSAARMSRLSMELGGRDILLVLNDADIDKAAAAAVTGGFKHCGQSCNAVECAYVDPRVMNEFTEKVLEHAGALKVADPMDPLTDIGPMANRPSFEKTQSFYKDAVAKGAKVIFGGRRLGAKGFLMEPAILTNINNNMRLAKEEVFGPILPIRPLKDIDKVMDEVNMSEYGLGFSVWSRNISKAKRIAAKALVGTAVVNGLPRTNISCPWGGMRKTGLGRILSHFGIRCFTEQKNLRYPK
ncbi:MAG: aldehyde dehydrogenase [Candidatus Omnitrophica bacterium]|nr:aldehyde dehydrogenase [Candidatus Omnitrophota bacterium]